MKNKQEILEAVREGLRDGTITGADLQPFVTGPDQHLPGSTAAPAKQPPAKPEKLSAVDAMFYIAGLVLFAAIMSIIVQSWNDGEAALHIALSAGVGAVLWLAAYVLIRQPAQSDITNGLVNALLVTGSLSVIVGGYIITNEIIGGFSDVNFIPAAIMFAVLGAVHLGLDRLIKRDSMLLIGVLLCVATFPALLFGILRDTDVPRDVWAIVLILSAGLLAVATRVVAKLNPGRQKLRAAFDPFAAFLALATMYVSSFGEYGVWWLGALVAGVFGIFYLSIIAQNKHLLGNASFFLVLTVITISFKYFSGYGITTSLIVATLGLLGSAAVASGINKKYFKV